ncbi:hypothetical protein CERZMDRAFT_96205 [Cercospora zeae-maydis SCOH1-5]|uniref:Uncharacterized protein n=1 Tax=Cercospora zeae-maydis SCOH1-5 TaxID=717836 RepID=A0A6A6FJE6_9PEZI|nr:hypothetical protein CERZMDRAFT_96205 [Cercospora zeae-maydis SCOH1-5]
MKSSSRFFGAALLQNALTCNAWLVVEHSGLACSGQRLHEHEAFIPNQNVDCRMVQNRGVASSLVVTVREDGEGPFVFDLWSDGAPTCSVPVGAGGILGLCCQTVCKLQADPFAPRTVNPGDTSLCFPLEGATYFSITPGPEIRAPRGVGKPETSLAIRGSTDLAIRQVEPLPNRNIVMAAIFTALAATTTGVTGLVAQCPNAVNSWTEAVQCAGGIIAFLFEAIASFYAVRATRQGARTAMTGDPYADFLGLVEDEPLLLDNGETTVVVSKMLDRSMARAGVEDPELHIVMQSTNKATGEVSSAAVDWNPSTDWTMASSGPNQGSVNQRAGTSARRSTGSDGLSSSSTNEKRQVESLTAYYSWRDWGQDAWNFAPRNENDRRAMALNVYEIIKNNGNIADFCLDMGLPGSSGLPSSVNTGYFALFEGNFRDQLSSCP